MPTSSNAFDNSALVDGLCRGCNVPGFNLLVSYVYDASAAPATITFTSTSAFPTGDTGKKIIFRIYDDFGNRVISDTTTLGTAKVVDVSVLDASKPLAMIVSVLSTNGLYADGGAFWVRAGGGNVSFWDKNN